VRPEVTYVTDGIAAAMAQAKAAAGDRNVMVHGAYTAQRALGPVCSTSCRSIRSRCCSAPGDGCSMYCRHASSLIVRVIDTPDATHIRYHVRR